MRFGVSIAKKHQGCEIPSFRFLRVVYPQSLSPFVCARAIAIPFMRAGRNTPIFEISCPAAALADKPAPAPPVDREFHREHWRCHTPAQPDRLPNSA